MLRAIFIADASFDTGEQVLDQKGERLLHRACRFSGMVKKNQHEAASLSGHGKKMKSLVCVVLLVAVKAFSQANSGAAATAPNHPLAAPPSPQVKPADGSAGFKTTGEFAGARPPELPKELTASSVKSIQVPVFSSYGAAVCDGDGNLFFHLMAGTYGISPILRISPDGEKSTLYKVSQSDETKPSFMSFNVTPLGVVRELAESTEGNVVLEFDSDGNVSSRTRLATPEHVSAQEFAAFENGSVLFYGYYNENAPEKLRGQRYVALFAPSGQLIKVIQDEEKLDLGVFNTTFQNGAATLGKDGYIYLVRQSEVLVISQSGEIVRRMPFEKNPRNASATKISYSGGLLAIVLSSSGKPGVAVARRYLVLDSSTGEERGYYAPSAQTSNIDVCFSRKEGFTFIHNTDGKMSLIYAALR